MSTGGAVLHRANVIVSVSHLDAKLLSLLLLAVGIDLSQDDLGELLLEGGGGLGVVGSELLAVSCVARWARVARVRAPPSPCNPWAPKAQESAYARHVWATHAMPRARHARPGRDEFHGPSIGAGWGGRGRKT